MLILFLRLHFNNFSQENLNLLLINQLFDSKTDRRREGGALQLFWPCKQLFHIWIVVVFGHSGSWNFIVEKKI